MSSVCLEDISARVEARLTQTIGGRNYKMWFADARLESEEQQLVVRAPNRYAAKWIADHYRGELQRIAREELGGESDVRIVGEANTVGASAAGDRAVQSVAVEPRRNGEAATGVHALRHSWEDYVVGESNRVAYGSACQLIETKSERMNSLFVHGGCGVGKTHLLQGLCGRFAKMNPGRPWRYTTAEQFTNEYVMSVQNNSLGKFRARLRRLDLLAVDDVHFLSNKTATQTELANTFDAILGLSGAKVAMAGDVHPGQIAGLSEALSSRLLGGMLARIDVPDGEMRLRLIRALGLQLGLQLMETVVPVIAECCHGSVRELEGMLTTLRALAMLEASAGSPAGPIGHALVSRLLGASGKMRPAKPIRFGTIVEEVCRYLNLEQTAVLSKSRQRQLVLARSLMVCVARRQTAMSFPDIARAMRIPNHSTVITAWQRIERDRKAGKVVELGVDRAGPALGDVVDVIGRNVVNASV